MPLPACGPLPCFTSSSDPGEFNPSCIQMIVFVAAGFSLRGTGETPVPPKKLVEKYSFGRQQERAVAGGQASWPLRDLRRFRYTINTARAAGVTPEMRAAWPRDRGRTCFNFSRISSDNPGTPS